jgi:hypothetical protein
MIAILVHLIISLALLLYTPLSSSSQPLYFCTAANHHYYYHLINLIGSIHHVNFEELGEISVFNLGMSKSQLSYLKNIQKVVIYEIEQEKSHVLTPYITNAYGKEVPGWYAFKHVAMKQILEKFPYTLWVDAGTTMLRSVAPLFDYIRETGYFLATTGTVNNPDGTLYHPVGWGVTQYVGNKFGLYDESRSWILQQEDVMGGLQGLTRETQELFLLPLYKLTDDLRNFQDDGTTPRGFGSARHDQTLLSIIAYSKKLHVFNQDYTQQQPMMLTTQGDKIPFYVTWHSGYVSEKTHIYNSRGDIGNFTFYSKQIRMISS